MIVFELQLYIGFGSGDSSLASDFLSDLWRYDYDSTIWKQLAPPGCLITGNASCPSTRLYAASTYVKSGIHANKIIIHGGGAPGTNYNTQYGDMWIFDLDSLTYSKIEYLNEGFNKSGHLITYYNDQLHVYGGFYKSNNVRYGDSFLRVFNFSSRIWTSYDLSSSFQSDCIYKNSVEYMNV